MTGTGEFDHVVSSIQLSRAYELMLLAASCAIGSCVTGDLVDYWLRRAWRSRLVARFWSQVHAWLWPF